ncbi:hypothetical protein E4U52_005860 [Claviceps spartinae]|nr:hypothetical protein E4U52_005860 [Claviceps spartinae]
MTKRPKLKYQKDQLSQKQAVRTRAVTSEKSGDSGLFKLWEEGKWRTTGLASSKVDRGLRGRPRDRRTI